MSHARGVLNESLGVTQAYSSRYQGEAIHEGHAGFLATLQFTSNQSSKRCPLTPCKLMEGRIRKAGIRNPGNGRMLFQQLCDSQGRGAMTLHSQLKCLEAAQEKECGQRRNGGAGEVTQPMTPDVLDDLFRSRHNARDQVAMPANKLGR
jgi:hypothetical protein